MTVFRTVACSVALLGFFAASSFAQTSASVDDSDVLEMSQRADAFRKIIVSLESDAAVATAALMETQAELDAARLALAETERSLSNLREEEVSLTARLQAVTVDVQAALSEQAIAADEIMKLQQEQSALAQEIRDQTSAHEQEQAEAQARLDAVKAEIETVTTALSSLEERFREAEAATAEAVAKRDSAAALAEEERTTLEAQATQTLASLNEQLAIAESETAAALIARDEANADMQDARAAIDAIASQRDMALEELEAIAAQKLAQENALAELNEQFTATKDRTDQLTANALSALADATDARNQAIADTAAARAELAALQEKIDMGTQASDVEPRSVAEAVGGARVDGGQFAPAQVRSAVLEAPGLNTASQTQLAELEELLSEGVCAHDALTTVFGSANRQTLVSLVRSLGRC